MIYAGQLLNSAINNLTYPYCSIECQREGNSMPSYENPEGIKRNEINFTYHPPNDEQFLRYQILRKEAKNLANILTQMCPSSRELSLAITYLETALMWANAAIARNERDDVKN